MILKKIIKYLKRKYSDVFFIGNAETLPPPLKKEEELDALIRCKSGDINARNKLIEHNLRLVVFLAKKYQTTGYDLEDLVSIGTLGLIKGISTYKIDKNIRLATYASRCITNEILMFIRKNKNRKGEVSFEDALNYDGDGNELRLEDITGTDEEVVHNEIATKFDKELLKKELDNLPKRDKEIMIMRYGLENTNEYTQKEVAEKLGISQSYISRIEKKVIRKLKSVMKTN